MKIIGVLKILNLFRKLSMTTYRFSFLVCRMSHKSASLIVMALSVIVFLCTSPATAEIENGSFEILVNNHPRSWETTAGYAFPSGNWAGFIRPTDGDVMMQLETIIDYGLTTAAELEEFLNLTTGSLNELVNGTVFSGNAISQDFMARPGDTVTFEWNFATSEAGPDRPSPPDFVFVSVVCQSEIHLEELVNAALSTLPSAPIFFVPSDGPPEYSLYDHTGYRAFSTTLTNGGACRLGIGIAQLNSGGNSILFVDNVRLIADPTALSECESDLSRCESILVESGVDVDLDGVIDLKDQCPGTADGLEVDESGCSLAQFCSSIEISGVVSHILCYFADWKEDEGFIFGFDCKVEDGICRPR